MEYEAIKNALTRKMDYLKTYSRADFEKLLLTIRPQISIYNVYGRIIFKRYKGCTYYYKILKQAKNMTAGLQRATH